MRVGKVIHVSIMVHGLKGWFVQSAPADSGFIGDFPGTRQYIIFSYLYISGYLFMAPTQFWYISLKMITGNCLLVRCP